MKICEQRDIANRHTKAWKQTLAIMESEGFPLSDQEVQKYLSRERKDPNQNNKQYVKGR